MSLIFLFAAQQHQGRSAIRSVFGLWQIKAACFLLIITTKQCYIYSVDDGKPQMTPAYQEQKEHPRARLTGEELLMTEQEKRIFIYF